MIRTFDMRKRGTNYQLAYDSSADMDKLNSKVVEDWRINSDDLQLI